MPGDERTRARELFAHWLERTNDYRAAAARAGVSERTGRRWRAELAAMPERRTAVAGRDLPVFRLPFHGRRAELTAIAHALAAGRLVTVLGCAGIGKTRLALQAAAAQRAPAWFVDVAHARSADDAARAVADATGDALDGPAGGDPLAAAARSIAARGRALWVFDNCERLDDPAILGRWIDGAPHARALATSRRRLGIAGEAVIALDALPVPDGDAADWARAAAAPAVQVFLDRARHIRPGYAPEGDERAAVVELVTRLDGIPLAIELAAARIGLLDARALRDRLAAEPALLAGNAVDAPDRQRTMADALQWSWSELSDAEQAALAQTAVFRGPFEVAAAEAVIDLAGCRDARPLLLVLESLRDRSLLRTVDDGGVRLATFEVVREFAAARLHDRGDAGAVRARHAEHYLAAHPPGAAFGAAGAEALERTARDREQLLEALRATERPDHALRAALALDALLAVRGPFRLHEASLTAAIEAAERAGTANGALAAAYSARASARLYNGAPLAARADADRARAIAESVADARELGRALLFRGCADLVASQLDAADVHLQHARAVSEAAGDAFAHARAVANLALVAQRRGAHDDARPLLERALAIHRAAGDRLGAAHTLTLLGSMHHAPPDQDVARAYYAEALDTYRAFRNPWREGYVLANLGIVDHEAGRHAEAEGNYRVARELAHGCGAAGLEGIITGYLGALAHERGRPAEAAGLYERARQQTEAADDARYASLFAACLAAATAVDDPAAAAAAIARARADAARTDDATATTAVDLLAAAVAVLAGGSDDAVAAAGARAAALQPSELACDEVRLARRLLRRALRGATGGAGAADAGALLVAEDGAAVRTPDGAYVDLRRRAAPRRILQRLAAERLRSPGASVDLDALAEAGWPDQRIGARSRRNRLHVALATLRKLGLRSVLTSAGGGYLLAPDVPVRIVPDVYRA